MDVDEHVWEYVEIWGALNNIRILFGYDAESMTTDLICGITDESLIEVIMNSYDVTRQQAERRIDTRVLQEFIGDVKSKKISGIDEVLMNWKREQLRKKQAQSTGRWMPGARAKINCLLVDLEHLTREH